MSRRRALGDINMRGRRTVTLRCGCCDAIDFREKITQKRIKWELRNPDWE